MNNRICFNGATDPWKIIFNFCIVNCKLQSRYIIKPSHTHGVKRREVPFDSFECKKKKKKQTNKWYAVMHNCTSLQCDKTYKIMKLGYLFLVSFYFIFLK